MDKKFELEIWPDKKKIKTVFISIIVVTLFAWLCHIIGNMYWEEYSYWVKNTKGVAYESGWPVKLYWWGLYIGIIGPVAYLIVYLMVDTKRPSLAISKDGLYVNQQLIKDCLVPWNNIYRIEKKDENNEIKLSIYFLEASKIIESQSSSKAAFLRENLKDGKPLIVSNKLSIGDFNQVYSLSLTYLNK
jgi:hypothetical protein